LQKLFNEAFLGFRCLENIFAVKLILIPRYLKKLKEEGFGGDCVSAPEVTLCDAG
jgi:diaminopimelate decarboxylase